MKRSPLRKKSKQKITVIQDQIWQECKRIIRARYGNVCYTCGKTNLEGSNWHTGHMIPKASLGAYLKYDLRVLRPQCYYCNMNLGGMGATFIYNMRQREGDAYVDGIFQDRNVSVKAYEFYEKILSDYRLL